MDVYILKRLEKELVRADTLANAVRSLLMEPSSSGSAGTGADDGLGSGASCIGDLLSLMDEQQTCAPFASLTGMCGGNATTKSARVTMLPEISFSIQNPNLRIGPATSEALLVYRGGHDQKR